jgi:hypothetical protein
VYGNRKNEKETRAQQKRAAEPINEINRSKWRGA